MTNQNSQDNTIDEILNTVQEKTILVDNKFSLQGPAEDARAFQDIKDTAKLKLKALLTSEAQKGYDIAVKNIPEHRPYKGLIKMLKLLRTESIALADLKAQSGEES